MPWTISTSNTVASFSGCMAQFLAYLIAHGWTHVSGVTASAGTIYKPDAPNHVNLPYTGPQPSSLGQQAPYYSNAVFDTDGTTVITYPTLVNPPGGIATPLAWMVIQQPGSTRQFCFQRGSAFKFQNTPDLDTDWRITYSPGGLFTGGTDTVAASASDEVIIAGGGTEAAPTFVTLFNTLALKLHMVVGDSAEGYSCACFCTYTDGGTPTTSNSDTYARFAFVVDMVRGAPAGDTDPCVLYIGDVGTVNFDGNVRSPYSNSPIARIGATYEQLWLQDIGGTFPAGIPVNPLTSKESLTVPSWSRPHTVGAPNAFKGYSTIFKYKGVLRVSLDTFNLAAAKDQLSLGAVTLPWDGSTPPHTAGGNADAELIFPPPTASGKKYFLACHDSATPPHRVYWVSEAVDISQAPTPTTPPLVTSTLTVLSSL